MVIFVYFWMKINLENVTPNVIDPWEAWITLLMFPVLVLVAYGQDRGWVFKKHEAFGEHIHGHIQVQA
jgi:hypothetical protein